MFERLGARAAAAAERRAEALGDEIAGRLAGEVPEGIAVRRGSAGIEISGRGVARRFALEPAFRWIIGRVK